MSANIARKIRPGVYKPVHIKSPDPPWPPGSTKDPPWLPDPTMNNNLLSK